MLDLMCSKGVNRSLLVRLSKDKGFLRFCNEWCAQRWDDVLDQNISSAKDRISTLQSKISSYQNIITGFQSKNFEKVEKPLSCEIQELGIKLLNAKSKSIRGIDDFYNPKSTMTIYFNEKRNLKFMKCIQKLKIPYLRKISMTSMSSNKAGVKKFVKNSFLQQAKEIWISNGNIPVEEVEGNTIDKFSKEISLMIPKALNKVTIYRFDINQIQLRRIFYLCRDKQEVKFSGCKLHLEPAPDLSRCFSNCTIQKLEFYLCGCSKLSNWDETPQKLELLISLLSESNSLLSSLRHLILTCSNPSFKNYTLTWPRTVLEEKYIMPHIQLRT
ncbi:unnamed protein product [Moneuplotes crassus]|uniref:Uncharacterized protein n=1 Tax=Euplotes crassus TaxID=5936 RepID=A0AAD1XIX7_EUPCR|nr:unnamed protein product [Moneuplotes crassus]